MKAKKNPVGAPKKKDKKVIYAFTVIESKKKKALKKHKKKAIDESLRETINAFI